MIPIMAYYRAGSIGFQMLAYFCSDSVMINLVFTIAQHFIVFIFIIPIKKKTQQTN